MPPVRLGSGMPIRDARHLDPDFVFAPRAAAWPNCAGSRMPELMPGSDTSTLGRRSQASRGHVRADLLRMWKGKVWEPWPYRTVMLRWGRAGASRQETVNACCCADHRV